MPYDATTAHPDVPTAQATKEGEMLTVTFHVYSKLLGKEFFNVEQHRSMDDARLRALALGWTIYKVEEA